MDAGHLRAFDCVFFRKSFLSLGISQIRFCPQRSLLCLHCSAAVGTRGMAWHWSGRTMPKGTSAPDLPDGRLFLRSRGTDL